jgi:hypothetical protein
MIALLQVVTGSHSSLLMRWSISSRADVSYSWSDSRPYLSSYSQGRDLLMLKARSVSGGRGAIGWDCSRSRGRSFGQEWSDSTERDWS